MSENLRHGTVLTTSSCATVQVGWFGEHSREGEKKGPLGTYLQIVN